MIAALYQSCRYCSDPRSCFFKARSTPYLNLKTVLNKLLDTDQKNDLLHNGYEALNSIMAQY